jgi:DNA polymerase-3 subunit delta
MQPAKTEDPKSLVLICGEDEFEVKQSARRLFQDWCGGAESLDQEIIDAAVSNSGEALAALARLREALQTLPFFGGGKVIWFQNCTFLGDERAATAQAVTAALGELAQEFKTFPWDSVRLLISAGKVDKRKTFYKTIEKIGRVETYAGWSAEDRNWSALAEDAVAKQLRALRKEITPEAQARLVTSVGPNSRQLYSETEKLALYVGTRPQINVEDVDAIVTRSKQSRAFALGDALGERNLHKALRTLDGELWDMKRDSQKSEIGLLYGVISKIRVMIFLKEMLRAGWLKGEVDYNRFKVQLERVPAQALPEDRRFNPLAMNPYVLFKALAHAKQYTIEELVAAMQVLLECNRNLVLSGLDEAMVLQRAFIKIISRAPESRVD